MKVVATFLLSLVVLTTQRRSVVNRYRRGLGTSQQAKTSKSGHAIFSSFFRRVRATSMTKHRVENTRVQFWTFSPVLVKNIVQLLRPDINRE